MPGRDDRQVGIVDARGRARHAHGRELHALGRRPDRAPGTPCRATSSPARTSSTRWPRASRRARARSPSASLLALAAGDAAGGDSRGRQSAAIVDRLARRRLRRLRRPRSSTCARDDHADPVGELRRLYDIHVLLTGTTPEEQKLPLEGDLGDEVRELLARAGYPGEDGAASERRAARVRRHREPRGALVARGPARSRRARAPALARQGLSDPATSRRARPRPIASR